MTATTCRDCGNKATGLRCRACAAKHERWLAAVVLEPDDRALIAMRDGDRLSLASMGRRLGVTPPAVQHRLSRARARLKVLKEKE